MDNNNELQQEVITIASAEFTNWGLKIKDQKGLIYNISQFKKNTQDETVAYQSITKLPKNGLGMTKCFKFAVVPNNQGGQSRYVRIIEDAQTAQATSSSSKPASNSQPKQADNGWGKCKHAFLVEVFKKYVETGSTDRTFWEKEAEMWADMSMRNLKQQPIKPAQQTQPDYEQPEFPEDDEVQVENIPF